MALTAAFLLLTGLVVGPLGKAEAATSPVTVSLTFDDSNADQMPPRPMKSLGLHGTFYTVTGWVDQPSYLTLAQVQQIAADGNEIAGHTVDPPGPHPGHPGRGSAADLQRPGDPGQLGIPAVDFAYPFSDANATVEADAKGCGYNTSRGLGDVASPASCTGCVYAETTPPPDPNYLRAPDQVDSTWTLANLKAEVTNAVATHGGWVILTFHHICTPIGTANCPADQSTTPAIFNAFISWLAGYANTAANKTTVKTIDQQVRAYLGSAYPAYQTPARGCRAAAGPGRGERPEQPVAGSAGHQHRVPDLLPVRRLGHQHGGLEQGDRRRAHRHGRPSSSP